MECRASLGPGIRFLHEGLGGLQVEAALGVFAERGPGSGQGHAAAWRLTSFRGYQWIYGSYDKLYMYLWDMLISAMVLYGLSRDYVNGINAWYCLVYHGMNCA